MKRNLLRESILPAFWLLVFIASSKSDARDNELKKANNTIPPINTRIKNEDQSASGASNGINKNKEATFTKAVYLSGF